MYFLLQGEVDSFLEEAVVRRELSDNYVYYEPNYDNLEACAGWAKETLRKHSTDKREYIYTWCVWLPLQLSVADYQCHGTLMITSTLR